MTTSTSQSETEPAKISTQNDAPLIVLTAPFASEDEVNLEQILANLAHAWPGQSLRVATAGDATVHAASTSSNGINLITYPQSCVSTAAPLLTATDFVTAADLLREHDAQSCLMLGADAHTFAPEVLAAFSNALSQQAVDLAVPCYYLGAHDGLVNSAILYPLTRALYGTSPRFPLATDLGLSTRNLQRLAVSARRFVSANQEDALLWPVAEAAAAHFSIVEVDAPGRALAQPATQDLNALFSHVLGSLFSDIEARAAFWQRVRIAKPQTPIVVQSAPESAYDAASMVAAFQLAYANLQEIWAIVLPPTSLLGLKRIAQLPPSDFVMPDSLWARIIYDFILAFHMRTINRGHLLGALTPLYLAWVASHLNVIAQQGSPSAHREAVAVAFESDKSYLVARWRWPDRFNP